MRQVGGAVCLGLVLLAGCRYGPNNRNSVVTRDTAPPPPLKVPQLVEYLNENARRVQAVQCTRVDIDAEQDGKKIPLAGQMACQKPRNFRLKGVAVGKPAVDVGSNKDEFWFWISQNDPPYVHHCSYTDLARGVRVPFPFQPDMIAMALGIAPYDPAKSYQLKTTDTTLELIEPATSPEGLPVKKVVIFDRRQVDPRRGQPQVLAYALLDERGNVTCRADVRRVSVVSVTRESGAVLPVEMTLVWPKMKAKLYMKFNDMQVVNITPERAGRLFTRSELSAYPSFDLARGAVDGAGPQRASYPSR